VPVSAKSQGDEHNNQRHSVSSFSVRRGGARLNNSARGLRGVRCRFYFDGGSRVQRERQGGAAKPGRTSRT
jgi:hypothetical protein